MKRILLAASLAVASGFLSAPQAAQAEPREVEGLRASTTSAEEAQDWRDRWDDRESRFRDRWARAERRLAFRLQDRLERHQRRVSERWRDRLERGERRRIERMNRAHQLRMERLDRMNQRHFERLDRSNRRLRWHRWGHHEML